MAARHRRGSPTRAGRVEARLLRAAVVAGAALLLGVASMRAWRAPAAAQAAPDAAELASAAVRSAPTLPAAVFPGGGRLQSAVVAIVARFRADAVRLAPRHRKALADETEIAVYARELPSAAGPGAELVAHHADRALRPASNLKLATTAAALVLLGPAFEFQTRFEAAGPIEGGALRGDLVVRAAGDPLYVQDDAEHAERRLGELALELAGRGLRRVDGALVLDEGSFPDPGPGPAWPSADQRWADYCALAGGFSAGGGILVAEVAPGLRNRSARVALHPSPSGLAETIGVATVNGARNNLLVGANASGVSVRGEIGAKVEPVRASFAHPDPVQLFGAVLSDRLRRAGIELAGGVRRERGARGGEPVAVLRSRLLDALVPINTHSVNSVADQVFLATGLSVAGSATRGGGRAATAIALRKLGLAIDGLVQVDGSGLSRDNRISARQLANLIAAVLSLEPAAAGAFRSSLAVAGQSGTLDGRMRGTRAEGRVRAKTGFIGGTSALSGVALAEDGREIAFSILVNYPEIEGLNNSCWKKMQDEIALALLGAAP